MRNRNKITLTLTATQMEVAQRFCGTENTQDLLGLILGIALNRYEEMEYQAARLRKAGMGDEIVKLYCEAATDRLTVLSAERFLVERREAA